MLNLALGTMVVLSMISGMMLGRFESMGSAVLQTGRQVVDLCLVLLGNMALWGGLLNVAKQGGLTEKISKWMYPLVRFLFPKIQRGSEICVMLCMSMMANLLGLGAAAIPLGLKAMQLFQDQSKSDTASDDMVTLVVLNTASFQLLPTTAAVLRQSAGSDTPMDILIPVWLATAVSLFVAIGLSKVLRRVTA